MVRWQGGWGWGRPPVQAVQQFMMVFTMGMLVAIVMFVSFALLVCVSVVTDSCAASSVNFSEELVRELATAAKTIGNDELAQQLWLHGAACLGYRATRV